ncbi:uncharacterized protein SPSK_01836 [Sporothrix schenckii 1099-18]|uniref:TLC domain-containing protein n=2 Tax=Sporothrix schenckii TaxID=29908 RepID=U7PNC8_SPOS1|nr:uncharacterized protein SPSK_01836 [Sporothrix schenckii 1099-18]ERS96249.1 hypothetical protein HMPREF1624_07158 [Sporothrix schenckii ATCC 58251]KJR86937.1 hypothetical protein SPSK_01836 [Sporothrix schenckii 1099-18]
MKDVFPIPQIPGLSRAVQPLADTLGFDTLPLHVHEVVLAALFYTFVQVVVSPVLSSYYFPTIYKPMNRAKKANWDSHVVSMVQSLLINALALWCMFVDQERKNMQHNWKERVYGYMGTPAMVSALACGYFVWDLVITVLNFDVFGPGLLAHAVSALAVFSFGFRPFLNYYGPVFILYELSTPFLNLHWFFDKLGMTGSRAQFYNGMALLGMFFSCRLVYGNYMSLWVYHDMWNALWDGPTPAWVANPSALNDPSVRAVAGNKGGPIPLWLFVLYVTSNLTLNSLNVHWFFKMIRAVRKRFEPAPGAPAGKEAPVAAAAVASGAAPADDAAIRHRATVEDLLKVDDSLTEVQ